MTKVFGAIGWMMVIFVKRRVRFGGKVKLSLNITEFEMFVIHPSEQKNISEHLLSTHCVVGPVLSIFEV